MPATATTLRNRLLSRARLRHLHVFVKVAELQTVRRAAEAVGITQPSATQALADLEQLLGCMLFLRHAQGMAATPAGLALLPIARRMLGLVDDTATQAAALAQRADAVVRVAAISAAIGSRLRGVLAAFARECPSILVQLQEADVARQTALLADGDVDCAVCRAPPVLPAGWTFTPLWPDRFAIVAGPAHPLARKRRVAMTDLLAATWLTLPTSIAARRVFDSLFEHAAEPPRTYSVVTAAPAMVWGLLASEPLLALVPVSVVQAQLESRQLVELRWSAPVPFGAIGVLAPRDGGGAALQRFVGMLERYAQVDGAGPAQGP